MEQDGHPWERREGETPRDFRRFCVYRDSGPSCRNYRAIAELEGITEMSVRKIACKHKWTKRVEAWDAELQERASAQVVEATISQRVEEAQELQGLVMDSAKFLMVAVRAKAQWLAMNPDQIAVKELPNVANVAMKLSGYVEGEASKALSESDWWEIPQEYANRIAQGEDPFKVVAEYERDKS